MGDPPATAGERLMAGDGVQRMALRLPSPTGESHVLWALGV